MKTIYAHGITIANLRIHFFIIINSSTIYGILYWGTVTDGRRSDVRGRKISARYSARSIPYVGPN